MPMLLLVLGLTLIVLILLLVLVILQRKDIIEVVIKIKFPSILYIKIKKVKRTSPTEQRD